jgi:hypothetical protein
VARARQARNADAVISARGLLFIVSPKRPDLFEALNTALRRERGVDVIYDRRAGLPARDDRPRSADRRRRKKIDDEIAEYGWAVVNVQ